MTAATAPVPTPTPTGERSAVLRAVVASVVLVASLILAAVIGQQVEDLVGSRARYLIQGIVMSALVVPAVWWLRTRRDGLSLESLGAAMEMKSVARLLAGVGIIATPVLLVSTLGPLLGWVTVTVDVSAATLQRLAIAVVTSFLFEALPEELVFRGYVYRTLAGTRARWQASILTVLLFLSMPVLGLPLQQLLLGSVSIGGADHIRVEYMVTLLLFGAFLQYLRVLTGTIWAGMGFHLAFLLANRVVGPRPTNMLRLSEITASGPLQMLALGSFLLIFVGLLAWPRLRKRPLGWRLPDAEASPR